MDLQAQDRCHRIGQTKRVMVYRLATAATVEETVLRAAKQKLKLEQLVVSKGKFKDIGKKTDKDDRLKEKELEEVLDHFEPNQATRKDQSPNFAMSALLPCSKLHSRRLRSCLPLTRAKQLSARGARSLPMRSSRWSWIATATGRSARASRPWRRRCAADRPASMGQRPLRGRCNAI